MLSKERWERVETIYHDALQCAPEARSAFLDHACDGDAEVRREVDSLLSFDGQAQRFIETPAMEIAARALASEESPPAAPDLNKSIGPYQLIARIGHGGTGDVYLAIDTRLDRKVALKVLAEDLTGDTERVSRFKLEARATSTLSHPNIVTIFEIGEVERRHYIVTEYVEGQTLRARLSGPRPGLPETLSVVTQLVEALAFAHAAGIIHRDIKPENLIIRRDGVVKVLDFGIAKLTNPEATSQVDHLTTRTGVVLGTAAYMSPEQARGQKVDHRTDIFSVGVLLYEMLSGRKPFEGETWSDVMAAVLIKEPPRLDSVAAEVPQALRRVVERCLEKSPEKRFQSASDLGFALRELATSAQTRETRAAETMRVEASPWSSPKQSLPVWIAVLVVLAAAIFVGALLLKNRFDKTQLAKPPRVEVKPPGSTITRLTWFDRFGKVLGNLGEPGEYSSPALSPGGDRIAVALNDSQAHTRDIWILSDTTNQRMRLTSEPGDDLNALWTPDGKWIIYTSERNGVRSLYRRPADGTGEAKALLETSETMNAEDISIDGRFLIFNVRNNPNDTPGLAILSLTNLKRHLFLAAPARAARFSPDGRWVAYAGNKDGRPAILVRSMGPDGQAETREYLVSSPGKDATTPMWRGDGAELFYLQGHVLMSVEIMNAGGKFFAGQPKPLFEMNIDEQERRNRYLVTKDGRRFLVLVKE